MTSDRVILRGHLAEAEEQYTQLDISASGDIIAMRNHLDPNIEPVEELNVDEALVVMQRLHSTVHKMSDLSGRIRRLKKDLGLI